ncbi:MAG TPA: DUF4388 domain-containing protein [Armatimonadota bacterium]|nr:DUF4388 domain-containing protein [Armatimonadota bacterium]
MAVKGSFADISLIEFMQMMHTAHKTGRLEVTFEKRWAMIIFNEGVIWHVEPRGFRGATAEEILYFLMETPAAKFTFQRVHVLPTLSRTVTTSTETLIMEGVKRMDDEKAAESEMGEANTEGQKTNQLNHVLKFKPGAEAKVRYVPQNVKRVLQLIDGQRSIGDVIKQCQLDSTQAAQIIKELITQDVVEAVEPNAAAPAAPVA